MALAPRSPGPPASLVCDLEGAAGKVDPVGMWKCEYEVSGQKRTWALTIKNDGDKLARETNWSDQETNVKDLR